MPKKVRKTRRVRRRKQVPGWGGAIGRVAKVGMKYVSKGGMAYKALRLARKVANAVNVEYKIYDTTITGVTPDWAGTSSVLNIPAQGTTQTTRIGDSIKCQNLTLRGAVYANTTAGTSNLVRLILIWDEQNQYSTLSDLLEVTGSTQAVFSPKNYGRRFRSKVLWDRLFNVSVAQGVSVIPFDEVFQLDVHTQFSAGTTTQFSGSLRLVMLSDKVTSLLPVVNAYARLSYTDD